MTDLFPVRRALISVSDKTGLVELAHVLAAGVLNCFQPAAAQKRCGMRGLRCEMSQR